MCIVTHKGESGGVFCQGFKHSNFHSLRFSGEVGKERGTGVRETSLRYFISTVHGSVSLVHFVCDGRSGVVNALGLSGAPSADGNHIPPSTLPTTRADRPEELQTVMGAVHR